MKLAGSPLKIEFLKKKLKLVTQTMEEQGVDMWLTFTREGNEDPLVQDLMQTTKLSAETWPLFNPVDRLELDHRSVPTPLVGLE